MIMSPQSSPVQSPGFVKTRLLNNSSWYIVECFLFESILGCCHVRVVKFQHIANCCNISLALTYTSHVILSDSKCESRKECKCSLVEAGSCGPLEMQWVHTILMALHSNLCSNTMCGSQHYTRDVSRYTHDYDKAQGNVLQYSQCTCVIFLNNVQRLATIIYYI